MAESRVTLRDFLAKGQLGPLTVEMTRTQVIDLLGEPEDWEARRSRDQASVWKYAYIQLAFSDDKVWYIGLYPEQHLLLLSDRLNLVGYHPTQETTLEEFKLYLKDEKLSYLIDAQLTSEYQTTLIVEWRASVTFDEQGKMETILYAKR